MLLQKTANKFTKSIKYLLWQIVLISSSGDFTVQYLSITSFAYFLLFAAVNTKYCCFVATTRKRCKTTTIQFYHHLIYLLRTFSFDFMTKLWLKPSYTYINICVSHPVIQLTVSWNWSLLPPFFPNFPLHYFGDSDSLCNNNGQYLQLHTTTKFNPISFQVSDIINYPTLGNFGSHEQWI